MNESEPQNVPSTNESAPNEPAPVVQPSETPAASAPAGGESKSDGQPAGVVDASSGEGQEGEQKKRRRRRRRRRKPEGADGAPADGAEGEATEASGEASADGDRPSRDMPSGDMPSGDKSKGDKSKGDRQPRAKKPKAKQNQKGGQKKRERPADSRKGGRRGPRDTQHSATVAVTALADMAHALLRIEGVDPLAMPRYIDLNLRVPLDGKNDIRHAAGTAVEEILKRVRAVREHEKALRPGAVYSYFADSCDAEGCRPTEPRHVFDGYSSTGKPKFADFVTLAIERKDKDVERMLAGEEIILTHVTMGQVLRTQQLAEFGGNSPVFKILGQVNAGLFRVLGDAGRCAFSFQLLRGTTLEGRVRLRLHPVGAVEPMDLADPALMQIMSRFQRKLDTEALRLEGKMKGGEVDEEQFVLPLLQDFAKQLASRTRNTGRRTQHGMERSEAGQRPTPKAYPDASEANDAAILWDIDQSTVVVVGPKGRVHVFSPAAKHVTSVIMQRSAVDRRRQQGRWRLAEPEERGEFRIQIKQLIASGNAVVAEDEPVAPAASPEQEPKS